MAQFRNSFPIIFWLFTTISSTTSPYQRIEPNEANCNNFYSDSIILSPNNKISTISLQNYFEMEFDLDLTDCTSTSFTSNILHIGATESTQDNHHFPHLSITNCALWQYTFSTNDNSNNLNGITFNEPAINILDSYHIYASFTPSIATLSINDIDRRWNASSRSNFFAQQWSIYVSNWNETASLDAILSNVCVRSWSVGEYEVDPTTTESTSSTSTTREDGTVSNIMELLAASQEIQTAAAVGGSILFFCCVCVIVCVIQTRRAKMLIAKNAELIRLQSISQNRNITDTQDAKRAAAIFAGVSPDPGTTPKAGAGAMTFASVEAQPKAAPVRKVRKAPPVMHVARLDSLSAQSPDDDDDFVDL